MSNRSSGEQGKTVVDAYYQAGVADRLREFARYLHPDFNKTAPPVSPLFVRHVSMFLAGQDGAGPVDKHSL